MNEVHVVRCAGNLNFTREEKLKFHLLLVSSDE